MRPVLISLFAFAALAACSDAPFNAETDLVGSWDGRQTTPNLQRGVLEFREDGALVITREDGEVDNAGWEALGPSSFTLTLPTGQRLNCLITDRGDWLDVDCDDGVYVLTLVRA